MIPERTLVQRLLAMFRSATLNELVHEYTQAHRLPLRLLEGTSEYMRMAEKREEWTVRYFEFCVVRYTGRGLTGRFALEAGCGSGGGRPHLASRFEHVVGVDVDLPALIIAAKRCLDQGLAGKVTLVAAMIEQETFTAGTFDAVKSTDVIEHVVDVGEACSRMISALRKHGSLFMLTPNKWNLFSPEPHVRLWGVQWLPERMADSYVRWRIGIPYRDVASLLSYSKFMRTLRSSGEAKVVFIPVEDKHLNPGSVRGRMVTHAFRRAPLSWLSRWVRPIQPTLEALCIRTDVDLVD